MRWVNAVELTEAVLEEAGRLGIDACGVCRAEPYARAERAIAERGALGYFADMGFTMRRPDRSCHPETLLRNARSVVAAAQSYARPEPERPDDEPRGRMPRYARRDEYALLRSKLRALGRHLQARSPGSRFAVYVDANHHVDREAAARSGIAVFGKNTLAITRRHGSWVVLGVLITDAELSPTQAAPELPFAGEFEDRVYGCDICQDVCPWNRGAERRAEGLELDAPDAAYPRLAEWLESDPQALADRYRRLYVPDRDGRLLQRNARVAAANVSERGRR